MLKTNALQMEGVEARVARDYMSEEEAELDELDELDKMDEMHEVAEDDDMDGMDGMGDMDEEEGKVCGGVKHDAFRVEPAYSIHHPTLVHHATDPS